MSISLAITTASAAFELIQKGVAAGRDLEHLRADIGRWIGATSHIAATADHAQSAGVITRFLKGADAIEAIAIQAVIAKHQVEAQRHDLMLHIQKKYGAKAWDDILHVEARLRRAQAKVMQDQRQFVERVAITVALFAAVLAGGGWRTVWAAL